MNTLVSQATPSPTYATRTQAVLAGVTGEDENAARRGEVVDEGVVVEEEIVSDGLTGGTRGKRKVE